MNKFKLTIEGGVDNIAPYVGALIHKQGVAKRMYNDDVVMRVKMNEDNHGAIIQTADFRRSFKEFLDLCELLSNNEVRVTLKTDVGFQDFLIELGEYSAKKEGMDLAIAEKMFGSQDDLSMAIGGTLLDHYLGDYYVVDEKGITIRIASGGKIFSEGD